MAFPEDVLAPAEGVLDTALGTAAIASIVPPLAGFTIFTQELTAAARAATAFSSGGAVLNSATTLAGGVFNTSNPANPLAAVNTSVTGVYSAVNALPVVTGGPVATLATSVVTAGSQLPVTAVTGLASSTLNVTSTLGTAGLATGIVNGVIAGGTLPLPDGVADILAPITGSTGALGTSLNALTALPSSTVNGLAATIFNTGTNSTGIGSFLPVGGLLASNGPLATANSVVNAVKTAVNPAAEIAKLSTLTTAVHAATSVVGELGTGSTLVGSIGSAVVGAINPGIGLPSGSTVGFVNQILGVPFGSSGVLGALNPALTAVTNVTGVGDGVLGGITTALGGTTGGLPGADILDGIAIPDVLGADSPLGILDGVLAGGDPLAGVTDLLGGDLLAPVTDLLGGAGGSGDLLAPVTDLLGGAGGDPLAPVTDLLGGAGGDLLAPVTDLLGGAGGSGDLLAPVTDLLGGAGGSGDLLAPVTDLLAGLGG